MSDVNKIVAAILTAGRVPTMKHDDHPRSMDDWLAEYEAWLEALNKNDAEQGTSSARKIADAINAEIHRDR